MRHCVAESVYTNAEGDDVNSHNHFLWRFRRPHTAILHFLLFPSHLFDDVTAISVAFACTEFVSDVTAIYAVCWEVFDAVKTASTTVNAMQWGLTSKAMLQLSCEYTLYKVKESHFSGNVQSYHGRNMRPCLAYVLIHYISTLCLCETHWKETDHRSRVANL